MEQIENKMVMGDFTERELPDCYCENCGEDFFEGDECFRINGSIYCEDCFEDLMFNEYKWKVNKEEL